MVYSAVSLTSGYTLSIDIQRAVRIAIGSMYFVTALKIRSSRLSFACFARNRTILTNMLIERWSRDARTANMTRNMAGIPPGSSASSSA